MYIVDRPNYRRSLFNLFNFLKHIAITYLYLLAILFYLSLLIVYIYVSYGYVLYIICMFVQVSSVYNITPVCDVFLVIVLYRS